RAGAAHPTQVVLPARLGLGLALPGPGCFRASVSLEEPPLLSPLEGRAHGPRHYLHGRPRRRSDRSLSRGEARDGYARDGHRVLSAHPGLVLTRYLGPARLLSRNPAATRTR